MPLLKKTLQSDERLVIQQAIINLPEKQRAVILLAYYVDLPLEEIAFILNLPAGTVKSHLHNAMKVLKLELKEDSSMKEEFKNEKELTKLLDAYKVDIPTKKLASNGYNWVYYCIYPSSLEKLDVGIEEIIIPAKNLALDIFGVKNWYFIRYMDANGAHFRLRFHLKDIYLEEFCEKMDELLLKCLDELEQKQPNNLKRLVSNKHNNQRTVPRIEKNLYEPEIKKYLNKRYLKLSEELFNYSSEIVCSVSNQLNLENINRYEFGLMLMNRVFDAIELQQDPLYAFLQNYLNYWSGSKKMSYKLMNLATQKKDVMEDILTQGLIYVDYQQKIDQYVEKLKYILLESYNEFGEEAYYHLLFHYTHMMNNRLGIWPIEEAYLSALFIQRFQGVIAQ